MFGSACVAETDLKMTSRLKHDIKTSKSSYRRHARESSYTPSCKTTFPSPGRVHEIGRACKQKKTGFNSGLDKIKQKCSYACKK